MVVNDIYLCVEVESYLGFYYGMGSRIGMKGWVYKGGEFNSLYLVDSELETKMYEMRW